MGSQFYETNCQLLYLGPHNVAHFEQNGIQIAVNYSSQILKLTCIKLYCSVVILNFFLFFCGIIHSSVTPRGALLCHTVPLPVLAYCQSMSRALLLVKLQDYYFYLPCCTNILDHCINYYMLLKKQHHKLLYFIFPFQLSNILINPNYKFKSTI